MRSMRANKSNEMKWKKSETHLLTFYKWHEEGLHEKTMRSWAWLRPSCTRCWSGVGSRCSSDFAESCSCTALAWENEAPKRVSPGSVGTPRRVAWFSTRYVGVAGTADSSEAGGKSQSIHMGRLHS